MTVPELKKLLRAEVCRLFKQDDRLWKRPIVEMLRELRESGFQAVVFGGTLRSLLYSRLYECRPGRPRDVDLVVRGASLRDVEKRFGEYLARRTRYGGLCLKREGWQFDVWPVGDTWAFRHENYRDAGFAELPFTTPFNLEAIAVEAWPCVGRPRQVFSGDDQFFEGIVSRIVELNCTDNPYPALTVVRGLVLATDLGYRVGPRLADYIVAYGSSMTESQFAEQQLGHYGCIRRDSRVLRSIVESVAKQRDKVSAVPLPSVGQLSLQYDQNIRPRVRLHCMDYDSRRRPSVGAASGLK